MKEPNSRDFRTHAEYRESLKEYKAYERKKLVKK